ncbi:MAG: U32 family peptidase, partial [Pseudomonas sp.]
VRVEGLAEVKVKNRFALGDQLELMTPRGNYHFELSRLHDRQQREIEVAPGDGHVVYLPIPEQVPLDYALLMRDLDGAAPAS